MKTFYLDYKINQRGEHTLHKKGCLIDNCLLMGDFYSVDSLFTYASNQFPQWHIIKCNCCE